MDQTSNSLETGSKQGTTNKVRATLSRLDGQIELIGIRLLRPRSAKGAGPRAQTDHGHDLFLNSSVIQDETTAGRVSTIR
jgi:hypothetical protein